MILLKFIKALVCQSEEVRSRCHVKHTLSRWPPETSPNEATDVVNSSNQNVRRQKSWDMLDQSAIAYARHNKIQSHQVRIY